MDEYYDEIDSDPEIKEFQTYVKNGITRMSEMSDNSFIRIQTNNSNLPNVVKENGE